MSEFSRGSERRFPKEWLEEFGAHQTSFHVEDTGTFTEADADPKDLHGPIDPGLRKVNLRIGNHIIPALATVEQLQRLTETASAHVQLIKIQDYTEDPRFSNPSVSIKGPIRAGFPQGYENCLVLIDGSYMMRFFIKRSDLKASMLQEPKTSRT